MEGWVEEGDGGGCGRYGVEAALSLLPLLPLSFAPLSVSRQ
jgi:hypothetical protein